MPNGLPEDEPYSNLAVTKLSATTYQDLFPMGWEVTHDDERTRSESPASEPSEQHVEKLPEFKLGIQSYEAEGYDPGHADLLAKLEQGVEITHCKQSDFERIFYHVNEDMKLTMLADILKYGDARELPLLFKLREDKSGNVRRNAERILEVLASRICPEITSLDDHLAQGDLTEPEEDLSFEIDEDQPIIKLPNE